MRQLGIGPAQMVDECSEFRREQRHDRDQARTVRVSWSKPHVGSCGGLLVGGPDDVVVTSRCSTSLARQSNAGSRCWCSCRAVPGVGVG